MEQPELLVICAISIFFVFFVLTVLSLAMRLIIYVFPEKEETFDKEVVAAIASTMNSIYPGTQITNIKESK